MRQKNYFTIEADSQATVSKGQSLVFPFGAKFRFLKRGGVKLGEIAMDFAEGEILGVKALEVCWFRGESLIQYIEPTVVSVMSVESVGAGVEKSFKQGDVLEFEDLALVSYGINDRQSSSHVNKLGISSDTMSHIVSLLFFSSGWTAQIDNKKSLKQLQLLPRTFNQGEHIAYSPGQILVFDQQSALYFQTDARLRFEHDVTLNYQNLQSDAKKQVKYTNGSIVQYGVGAILSASLTFVVTVL